MNEELKKLLLDAEAKLGDLKSVRKMEVALRKNSMAYEMRAHHILESMSEHLQKLKELMEDLDKKD